MTGQQRIDSQLDKHQVALPLRNRHVLLAEDCIDQGRLYHHYLKRAGAEVTWDGCGAAAVDSVIKTPTLFDAVMVDFQMPNMNGLNATRQLREIGYRGAIIAITSFSSDGLERTWLEAGCDELIEKPLSSDEIIEAVLRHMPVTEEATL